MEYMPLRLSCLTPQGKNHKMRGFECKIVEDLCIIVPILDISGACTSDRQPGVNDSPMVPPHHQHPPVFEKKPGCQRRKMPWLPKRSWPRYRRDHFVFCFLKLVTRSKKKTWLCQDFSGSNINARKKTTTKAPWNEENNYVWGRHRCLFCFENDGSVNGYTVTPLTFVNLGVSSSKMYFQLDRCGSY